MDTVIQFFIEMNFYNKELFDEIKLKTNIIDKPYKEIQEFVGCYFFNNDFRLILPKINSELDVLIYIHEYTHILFLDDEEELFPNIMEAIYIKKYINDKTILDAIKQRANNVINNSESDKHVIANKIKLKLISEEK